MEDHQSKVSDNLNRESETILSSNPIKNAIVNNKGEIENIPLPSPMQSNKEDERVGNSQCNGLSEPNVVENALPTDNLASHFDKQHKNGVVITNLSYLNNNNPDISSKEPPLGSNSSLELGLDKKIEDNVMQNALSKTENVLESQGKNEVVIEEKKLPKDLEPKKELPLLKNEVQNAVIKPEDKLPVDKESFGKLDIQEIVQNVKKALMQEELKQQVLKHLNALEEKKHAEQPVQQLLPEKKEEEDDFEIYEEKRDEEEGRAEEIQEIPCCESPQFDIYEVTDNHDSRDSRYPESYSTIDLHDCDSDPVPSEEELKLLYDSSDMELEDETQEELPKKRKFDDNEDSVLSTKKFKIEDDILLIDEQPDFITMTVHTDKEGTRTVETEETLREIPLEDEPPVEKFEPIIVHKIQQREEVEYVSQDPKENEDNYNKEWLKLKERIGSNEVERYKAIRERWRNLSIPNPNVNLTYRHVNNSKNAREENEPKINFSLGRNHQRSRSCTTFYENIISEVNNKYDNQKKRIMDQYNADRLMTDHAKALEVQIALLNANNPNNPFGQQNLRVTLYKHQQIFEQLENSKISSIENLEAQRQEEIAFYQRYIDEVRAFNKFYQGLTVHDNNLLLTPDQHEHLAETERMYCEFSKFYDPN